MKLRRQLPIKELRRLQILIMKVFRISSKFRIATRRLKLLRKMNLSIHMVQMKLNMNMAVRMAKKKIVRQPSNNNCRLGLLKKLRQN